MDAMMADTKEESMAGRTDEWWGDWPGCAKVDWREHELGARMADSSEF